MHESKCGRGVFVKGEKCEGELWARRVRERPAGGDCEAVGSVNGWRGGDVPLETTRRGRYDGRGRWRVDGRPGGQGPPPLDAGARAG